MDSFLMMVARDLYRRFGADLSRIAVIFPNKRAGLFFNDHLASMDTRPIWAPTYFTISELMYRFSDLKPADEIRMVCDLYRIFCEETGSQESLDSFYFWGELLIADLDDLDKNRVDADRLFSNLNDLKNISESADFLTEEQVEAIRMFFRNFSADRHTELKERFLHLWNALEKIYHRFRNELEAQGVGYEGMIYRRVVEQKELPFPEQFDTYVFVGFNVLNRVEHLLFDRIRLEGKALFYWDYDHFYTQKSYHEAGEFIRRNLVDFPSELDDSLFDALSRPKQVRYIAASTENAQARFMKEWTANRPADVPERENAIVLCNEALLMPVCHSLSADVERLNVTMGFPLRQTPVVGFISALVDLQIHGYDTERHCFRLEKVLSVLHHNCYALLSDKGKELIAYLQKTMRMFPLPEELQLDEPTTFLFTPCSEQEGLMDYLLEAIRILAVAYKKKQAENPNEDIFEQLYREALFKTYTTLKRISGLIAEKVLQVTSETLHVLLTKLLVQLTVPFHGEPVVGMQVMGILETRNLDFRRLAVLSLGEGLLPKANHMASFIPYNLRKAFGMTTPEHKNAVYAYYFYRLLQRAEDVTFLYNNHSENAVSREESRFLHQFQLEWAENGAEGKTISHYVLTPSLALSSLSLPQVEKTDAVYRSLLERYDLRYNPKAYLSPSALNSYIDCPLKFYYQQVLQLKTAEEVSEDMDAIRLGTLFHYAAELLYTKILPDRTGLVRAESIAAFIEDKVKMELLLDRIFAEKLFALRKGERVQYNGLQLIYRKVIKDYIVSLLDYDRKRAPFQILACELPVRDQIELELSDGTSLPLCIGGIIDRLDVYTSNESDTEPKVLRIVDYKTGSKAQAAVREVEALFESDTARPYYTFQTFFYSSILTRNTYSAGRLVPGEPPYPVRPTLFYPKLAGDPLYDPSVKMGFGRKTYPLKNYKEECEAEFSGRFRLLLQEIFDREVPFSCCTDVAICAHCDCAAICHRADIPQKRG